jgi:hypothetical protein
VKNQWVNDTGTRGLTFYMVGKLFATTLGITSSFSHPQRQAKSKLLILELVPSLSLFYPVFSYHLSCEFTLNKDRSHIKQIKNIAHWKIRIGLIKRLIINQEMSLVLRHCYLIPEFNYKYVNQNMENWDPALWYMPVIPAKQETEIGGS